MPTSELCCYYCERALTAKDEFTDGHGRPICEECAWFLHGEDAEREDRDSPNDHP